MTPKQFKNAIEQLGLGQSEVARLLGVDPRSARRWVAGDRAIFEPVAILVRLMLQRKLTPEDIEGARK